jgi:hypothetical protein
MDVNEHERLSNITLGQTKVLVGKDVNVNEHERLSNITLEAK